MRCEHGNEVKAECAPKSETLYWDDGPRTLAADGSEAKYDTAPEFLPLEGCPYCRLIEIA
jgi:hypothetical protein